MPKSLKPGTTLQDLFLMKIQALYDIEQEIIKALPKMAQKAGNIELKKGLQEHLEETRKQVERLEQIFGILGQRPQKLKVEAIRGIVEDAKWVMSHVKDAKALDASIIAAAQYVEHYEMAGYGTAKEWADMLGLDEARDLLEDTLEEEKSADEKLNDIAVSEVNPEVETGPEEE